MKNKYEMRGDTTAIFIKRKNGDILEVIIDTDDFNIVNKIKGKWHVSYSKYTKTFYCKCHTINEFGTKTSIPIHRIITNADARYFIDHINHDTLDNRRVNLREVTNSQNQHNRKQPCKTSKSGIIGVTWDNRINSWHARIMINGKIAYSKCFKDVTEAEKSIKYQRKLLIR